VALTNSKCPLIYTGQSRRNFQIKYNKHTAAHKNNPKSSTYAQHLINKEHSVGFIKDIMDIIFTTHLGTHPDTAKILHLSGKHMGWANLR
jgi:hypothetical protein